MILNRPTHSSRNFQNWPRLRAYPRPALVTPASRGVRTKRQTTSPLRSNERLSLPLWIPSPGFNPKLPQPYKDQQTLLDLFNSLRHLVESPERAPKQNVSVEDEGDGVQNDVAVRKVLGGQNRTLPQEMSSKSRCINSSDEFRTAHVLQQTNENNSLLSATGHLGNGGQIKQRFPYDPMNPRFQPFYTADPNSVLRDLPHQQKAATAEDMRQLFHLMSSELYRRASLLPPGDPQYAIYVKAAEVLVKRIRIVRDKTAAPEIILPKFIRDALSSGKLMLARSLRDAFRRVSPQQQQYIATIMLARLENGMRSRQRLGPQSEVNVYSARCAEIKKALQDVAEAAGWERKLQHGQREPNRFTGKHYSNTYEEILAMNHVRKRLRADYSAKLHVLSHQRTGFQRRKVATYQLRKEFEIKNFILKTMLKVLQAELDSSQHRSVLDIEGGSKQNADSSAVSMPITVPYPITNCLHEDLLFRSKAVMYKYGLRWFGPLMQSRGWDCPERVQTEQFEAILATELPSKNIWKFLEPEFNSYVSLRNFYAHNVTGFTAGQTRALLSDIHLFFRFLDATIEDLKPLQDVERELVLFEQKVREERRDRRLEEAAELKWLNAKLDEAQAMKSWKALENDKHDSTTLEQQEIAVTKCQAAIAAFQDASERADAHLISETAARLLQVVVKYRIQSTLQKLSSVAQDNLLSSLCQARGFHVQARATPDTKGVTEAPIMASKTRDTKVRAKTREKSGGNSYMYRPVIASMTGEAYITEDPAAFQMEDNDRKSSIRRPDPVDVAEKRPSGRAGDHEDKPSSSTSPSNHDQQFNLHIDQEVDPGFGFLQETDVPDVDEGSCDQSDDEGATITDRVRPSSGAKRYAQRCRARDRTRSRIQELEVLLQMTSSDLSDSFLESLGANLEYEPNSPKKRKANLAMKRQRKKRKTTLLYMEKLLKDKEGLSENQ